MDVQLISDTLIFQFQIFYVLTLLFLRMNLVLSSSEIVFVKL